ncbi:MAG: DUF4231 domain-containing protein [Leptolyngbyaceae cyanobacterium]
MLTACIVDLATALLFRSDSNIVIYTVTAFIILFSSILLVRNFSKAQMRVRKQLENQKKSQLYTALFGDSEQDESINFIRSRAIQYCQALIDDYKDARRNARITYYVFQIATVVLSGVTPILVVLDKTDLSVPWLRWLPVIFPAIASIATSISTSFPFQKTWVNANTAVELLEAEQEKFILGVTPSYRFYDIADPAQRKQKVQESIENFITQVNTIHLKQFQGSNQAETKPQAETEAINSAIKENAV